MLAPKSQLVRALVHSSVYEKYCRRYGIRLTRTVRGRMVPKTLPMMAAQIRRHEAKHAVRDGLYG